MSVPGLERQARISLWKTLTLLCLTTGNVARAWECTPPSTYTVAQLKELTSRECGKVSRSVTDFQALSAEKGTEVYERGLKPQAEWQQANDLCVKANNSRDSTLGASVAVATVQLTSAATDALNAWGMIMTSGVECCNMLEAPYCAESADSPRGILVIILLGVPILVMAVIIVTSIIAACRRAPIAGLRAPLPPCAPDPVPSDEHAPPSTSGGAVLAEPPLPPPASTMGSDACLSVVPESELPPPERTFSKDPFAKEVAERVHPCRRTHLEEVWLRHNCLRVLPGAEVFAASTAHLFVALHETFGFQWDSVKNQYEHLLSAWRSHVAMVADHAMGEGQEVNEGILLREALSDLHSELLDGFRGWRQKLKGSTRGETARVPLLGGVAWRQIESPDHMFTEAQVAEMSVQLAECVVYLLVWGECGNLRFMPEVIYFFTELALSASTGFETGAEAEHAGKRFLVSVVRPVYNMVFDEWYDEVDIDGDLSAPKERRQHYKDKKKLRPGFETFLPADVGNYDDWNELFCDTKRLAERLTLQDGKALFSFPHEQRFNQLPLVNWKTSLSAEAVKTHREIHSLWGVFASTHRIWLLHVFLFWLASCIVADDSEASAFWTVPSSYARFSTLCLLVPIHAVLWWFARWQVTGSARRTKSCSRSWKRSLPEYLLLLPIATYALVWSRMRSGEGVGLLIVCAFHYTVSAFGLCWLLLRPSTEDQLWPLTPVPWKERAVRYLFWLCVLTVKFALGYFAIKAVYEGVRALEITLVGFETPRDFSHLFRALENTQSRAYVLMWVAIWGVSFLLFLTDTQLWFVLGCAVLGIGVHCVQRSCHVASIMFEDAVAKIPQRFTKKVLQYTDVSEDLKTRYRSKPFSEWFPQIWDRIVEYMRYEDDIDYETMGDLSFTSRGSSSTAVTYGNLARPLELGREGTSVKRTSVVDDPSGPDLCRAGCGHLCQPGYDTCCRSCSLHPGRAHDESCPGRARRPAARHSSSTPSSTPSSATTSEALAVLSRPSGKAAAKPRVKVPDIFRPKHASEIFVNHYGIVPPTESAWPSNVDCQWRLVALARSMSLPMPRPFQAPYIPGLTVLIPHYGESILLRQRELWWEDESRGVALIDWLKRHWGDEFKNFHARKETNLGAADWPVTGNQWEEYEEEQWNGLAVWSSMRMQTLWRTVAGMCLYYPALQTHFEAQAKTTTGEIKTSLAHKSVWDPSDCFTCLVSMQMYKYFGKAEFAETNRMFEKFPSCLKMAFIDSEEKGATADSDGVHQRQRRRYYSCLIDKDCKGEADGQKQSKFRIELPGFPILGDGKADNQNHAIPFMRGTYAQCIDANQGAYFEQMLLLPCVLGEFRSKTRGDGSGKKIIGLPEHITSDIGSVGDMAASAEHAFGTILQRTYSVLGARMHYGHPDIMNKHYMMQQGGVSKGTKTLNLSEDIFAGMDFTLRGEGRKIKHCEYFHLAKGRDLGFNTVLGFFSKLASGSGEQIITRQMYRLGQVMHLPEALTFHYAHVGYYLNQFFISWSMPCLVCVWLLVLLSECEPTFGAFQLCTSGTGEIMGNMMASWFSWMLLLFLVASSLPLFAELWLERSLKIAFFRLIKQIFTLSPILFIFQSKVIGHYITNEFRFGGATYVSTGRGLPTDRRPFVGIAKETGFQLAKVGGLYLDYAKIAYYDGIVLLIACIFVGAVGGEDAGSLGPLKWLWLSIALIITSWLFAPFIYNPYQFNSQPFRDDLRAWWAFFTQDRGSHWVKWYEDSQLKPKSVHRFAIDMTCFIGVFFLLSWYEIVGLKVDALANVFPESKRIGYMRVTALLPPVGFSLLFTILLVATEKCVACCRIFGSGTIGTAYRAKKGSEAATDVEAGGFAAQEKRCCCIAGAPLLICALCVFFLDIVEVGVVLQDFVWVGWTRAFTAGLFLKYASFTVSLRFGETLLRARCFRSCACLFLPLATWVHAHRMCRDFFTSAFILCALTPWVVLNSLNDYLCIGCSVHKLLIYRDGGHFAREQLDFDLKRQSTVGGTQFFRSERSNTTGPESPSTRDIPSDALGNPSRAAHLVGPESAPPPPTRTMPSRIPSAHSSSSKTALPPPPTRTAP